MTRSRHLCLFALLLLLLPGFARAASGGVPADGADPPRAVKVVTVEQRALISGLSVSGRLVAREEAAVASQLAGYQVKSVEVDDGAQVTAGQVLARLDDTLLRADLAQQRANVLQARVAAERARQEAQRVATLDGSGVLSDEAIAERRFAARSAQAALAQAEALLASQEIRERLMEIRAPVAGRVLERSVRPGDVASPATVMFRLARDGLVEMDAEIPEQDLGFIHAGDKVDVELPTGARINGTVRLVGAEIDPATKFGRVRVSLPARPDLRPGGFARATFREESGPVSAVPEAAIHYGADGASVTVVGNGNIVTTVDVTTGRRAAGYVELRTGPAPGTPVLLGSQGFVLDGDQVTPVASSIGRAQ